MIIKKLETREDIDREAAYMKTALMEDEPIVVHWGSESVMEEQTVYTEDEHDWYALMQFCTRCEKYAKFELTEKDETFLIKGKPITVTVQYNRCAECGDVILDPNVRDPFQAAYEKYERLYGNRVVELVFEPKDDGSYELIRAAEVLLKYAGITFLSINRTPAGRGKVKWVFSNSSGVSFEDR